MKKKLLSCILVSTIFLVACNTPSSNQLLSFEEMQSSDEIHFVENLSEESYFSEDLVIITDEENSGGDESLGVGSSLLVNVSDQDVLYASSVYDKLYPASLTKLMTALVLLKHGELNDMVTVGYEAANIQVVGAKKAGLKEGDLISMEALLNILLIYSGNDASIAVAEHMYGSEADFATIMNEEAKSIGALHTNFVNSSGLHDDNQYTTAYDLYLIFHELLDYESFRTIINQHSYEANYQDKNGQEIKKTFQTTNEYFKGKELELEGIQVMGGKTGTTSKAGNCLILVSKNNKNDEFISIILKAQGTDQLYTQMTKLLSYSN